MVKLYTRYGIIIAIILIAYFLLLKLIGLHQYPVLSAANGVIFGVGILLVLKTYKASQSRFEYQKGFQLGFFTGGLATILFVTFMAFYMYQLDTEFSQNILDSWQLNYESGTFMILISLFIMGLATSMVLTLAFMQLLKQSWNTTKAL